MSKPETLMIDSVKYVRADSVDVKPTKKQILILQRGWVIVGDVSQEGTTVTINNCFVIRIWGTTQGLGELAIKGPLSKTKLDKSTPMQVHELTIIARLNTDAELWDV